jgi:tetratricopeptide (TPR) repeat protein
MVFHADLFEATLGIYSGGTMFSYRRAAAISLCSAFYLLSVVSFTAQTNTDKDRLLAAGLRQRIATRQPSGSPRLPFETSVVIYYGTPKKLVKETPTPKPEVRSGNGAASNQNAAGMPAAKAASQSRSAINQPIAPHYLQPVIISYRGYQPLAFAENERPTIQNTKHQGSGDGPPRMKKEDSTFAAENPTPPAPAQKAPKPIPFSAGPSNIVAGPDSIATEILLPATGAKPEEPLPLSAASSSVKEAVSNTISTPSVNAFSNNESIASVAPSVSSAAKDADSSTPVEKADVGAAPESVPSSAKTDQPANSEAATASSEPSATAAAANTMNPTVNVVDLNNAAVKETLDSNYDDALKHLQQAIEARPDVAKFYRNLSIVYERMKRIDDALAAARTAGKLAPTTPSVLEQLCALEVIAKNAANGIACYEGLKKIEPLDVPAQTYYAAALFHSGKLDESMEMLEKAVQVTPAFPDAFNLLGVVYYSQKRVTDAIAMFKSAVEAAPDQCQTRFNLGVAELANGNKAAAISQYNLIKSADPKLAEQLYLGIYGEKLLFVGGETVKH